MHNDPLFSRGEKTKIAGLGLLAFALNLVFWLALIAGGLVLLDAFGVI